MAIENKEVTRLQVGTLKLEIHPTQSGGEAAAQAVAQAIRQFGSSGKDVAVIFAAAASQIETLRVLTGMPDIPWKQVLGFHMDSYVNLPERSSGVIHLFSSSASDPARDHEGVLRHRWQRARPGARLSGLCGKDALRQTAIVPGGNWGKRALGVINDPPEADFNDPLDVKIVQLDDVTQQQQVAEGWFKSLRTFRSRLSPSPCLHSFASRRSLLRCPVAAKRRSSGG